MDLLRWNPLREMSVLQHQMNQFLGDTLSGWPPATAGTSAWAPTSDIYETENDLVLHADLPGIDPEQIDVRVENNVLTIRGERHFDTKVARENYHRVERAYGTFARSFALSTAVDPEKIEASYKNGVLTIILPKAERAKPKRVQIAATAA